MNKWSDFGISAVSYSLDKTHVLKLRIHEDNVESMGQAVESLSKKKREDYVKLQEDQAK